jgi:hypothetical protein
MFNKWSLRKKKALFVTDSFYSVNSPTINIEEIGIGKPGTKLAL